MAHRKNIKTIAISVAFEHPKTSWKLASIRYAGTEDELKDPEPALDPLAIRLPIPKAPMLASFRPIAPVARYEPHDIFAVVSPGRSKDNHFYQCHQSGGPLRRADIEGDDGDDTAFICEPPSSTSPKRLIDPWAVREDFLSLTPSLSSLHAFLKRWSIPMGLEYKLYPFHADPGHIWDFNDPRSGLLIPRQVWNFYALCHEALRMEPEAWLEERSPLGLLGHINESPYLEAKTSDLAKAIGMTITLDKLNRIPFQKCERHDCTRSFEVRSGKQFCNQACAHLVSVRKNREKARNERLTAKTT